MEKVDEKKFYLESNEITLIEPTEDLGKQMGVGLAELIAYVGGHARFDPARAQGDKGQAD